MITLEDAILAINPDAEFYYDNIDNIIWRRKTKPISKEEILSKYRELKDIEIEKAAYAKANKLSTFAFLLKLATKKMPFIYKHRQVIATSSVIISLFFVLTNDFHKVRYTILTDPYGTEFVYDRFTGKLKKKIMY